MSKQSEWANTRARLVRLFAALRITQCEIRLEACQRTFALSFAHRHKRREYNLQPELLGDIYHVVLACTHCHQIIEQDAKLTQSIFEELRPMATKQRSSEKKEIAQSRATQKRNASKESSKPVWMRKHDCVKCREQTDMLTCHHCGKQSI